MRSFKELLENLTHNIESDDITELDEAVLNEVVGKTVKRDVVKYALEKIFPNNPQHAAKVLTHYKSITGKTAGEELDTHGITKAVLAHSKGNTRLASKFLTHLNMS